MICDNDPDLGMATQLSGIIKLLVDPENMLAASVVNVRLITVFDSIIDFIYYLINCFLIFVVNP